MSTVHLFESRREYCFDVNATEVCEHYTKTNRPVAAGGWFTAAAGGIVMAIGEHQRASAGAELAVLEAERLPVHHETVTAAGKGVSNSDPWRTVSSLQPGQFLKVDVKEGQGRNRTGWFVKADDERVTLHDGKEVLAIDKAAIRRVRAVPLGREHSGGGAIGLVGLAGSLGAYFLLRPQGPLFGEIGLECSVICAPGPIADKDITGKQAGVLIGVVGMSTVTSLVMASKGRPKTVYEADVTARRSRTSSNSGTTEAGNLRSRTRSGRDLALVVPPKGFGLAYIVRW